MIILKSLSIIQGIWSLVILSWTLWGLWSIVWKLFVHKKLHNRSILCPLNYKFRGNIAPLIQLSAQHYNCHNGTEKLVSPTLERSAVINIHSEFIYQFDVYVELIEHTLFALVLIGPCLSHFFWNDCTFWIMAIFSFLSSIWENTIFINFLVLTTL